MTLQRDGAGCLSSLSGVAWDADAPTFLESLEGLSQTAQSDALWARCRWDVSLFCLLYLPERFSERFNLVQEALLNEQRLPWQERDEDSKAAFAAPRGAAKSTVESWAKIIHALCYGLEAFVGLAACDYDLSEDLAADIHEVFSEPEAYADLHRDYGPFGVSGGKTDFVVKIPGGDPRGCRVKALSMGGSVRGKKHRGTRFTLIVLDDSEHPEKVRSPVQREKTWEFLQKDILKAGQKGTTFRVVGTVLHADSMLSRLLKAPGWQSRQWQALISWPERLDLWEQARQIWADLSKPDRVQQARAFYREHQAEMDRGAAVLWPEAESLWDLMVLWWEDAASFWSEKQNRPRDPARQRFEPERFRRCRFDGRRIHQLGPDGSVVRSVSLSDCKRAAWLDPCVGKNFQRGDYAALAYVAKDPDGWRYLLSCRTERASPTQQRQWVWELFSQDSDCRFGLEDNGFQTLYGDDFRREQQQRRKAGIGWRLQIQGYTSTSNKLDRIDRLESPLAAHGWLQIEERVPGLVLEQFRDFPNGSHDDAPDAIERADWLVTGQDRPTATFRSHLR
jgi:predicted phage terminase large subunit-like protein